MPKKKSPAASPRRPVARADENDLRALAESIVAREQLLKQAAAKEQARIRAAKAMFRRGLPAALKKAGLGTVQVEPRRLRRLDREYNFVARGDQANFLAELRIHFKTKHLAQLTRLLEKFRADYPDKAGDRAVYGVVCGLVVDDEAADIARRDGFLVVEGRAAAELRVHPRRLVNHAK